MGSDTDYKSLKDMFLQSTVVMVKVPNLGTDGKPDGTFSEKPYTLVDDILAHDIISFIQQQLNDSSVLGEMNERQYMQKCENAALQIYIIAMGKHWHARHPTTGKRFKCLEKMPWVESAITLYQLELSKTIGGEFRKLELARIQAKQQITYQSYGKA